MTNKKTYEDYEREEQMKQVQNLVDESNLQEYVANMGKKENLLYKLAFPHDNIRKYEHVVGKIINEYLAEALEEINSDNPSRIEIFGTARKNLLKRINSDGFVLTPTKEEIILANAVGQAPMHDTKYGKQTLGQTSIMLFYGLQGQEEMSANQVADIINLSTGSARTHIEKGLKNVLRSYKIPSERHGSMLFYLTDDELKQSLYNHKMGLIAESAKDNMR